LANSTELSFFFLLAMQVFHNIGHKKQEVLDDCSKIYLKT
jgi:hypothetical protein